MAGEWIKVRAEFWTRLEFAQMLHLLPYKSEQMPINRLVGDLLDLASWFQKHGKQGKLRCEPYVIDAHLNIPGFASALMSVGWMSQQNGVLMLHKFCSVSASRKSLGKSIRKKILHGASCAKCGSTEKLTIDHIVPISRGGSCEAENLQALCESCNKSKGRKTMVEFVGHA